MICGFCEVEYHDKRSGMPGAAACRQQGRCPGHLRHVCPNPPSVRLVSADGLSVQYACPTHVRVIRAGIGRSTTTGP